MQSFRFIVLIVVSLTVGIFVVALGQSTASPDWETLRPDGEEFTVLMPKGSTFESGKEPYHKMELNKRIYLSQNKTGPVFAVVSLSGIKSNPAMYSEMQRVNSYVDAVKKLFPTKVRGKDAVAKLTLVGGKTLQGHAGREYRMTVGDLSGTIHAFATRKRFYALIYLNTKKDDAVQEEFLSSFVLPEKIAAPSPTIAGHNTPNVPETTQSSNQPVTAANPAAETAANSTTEAKVDETDPATGQPKKPRALSGGVLNGKAISLPKPGYPEEARAAGASGSVTVQVTIDEAGNVIDAKAVSGHPLLQQVSINAALQARFSPTSLMGEPVKVTGVIVYNFVKQ